MLRQCANHDEPGYADRTQLFTKHTRQTCLFECALKHSYKTCGCIGWDFPQFEDNMEVTTLF